LRQESVRLCRTPFKQKQCAEGHRPAVHSFVGYEGVIVGTNHVRQRVIDRDQEGQDTHR
jgi:hypothetical protein